MKNIVMDKIDAMWRIWQISDIKVFIGRSRYKREQQETPRFPNQQPNVPWRRVQQMRNAFRASGYHLTMTLIRRDRWEKLSSSVGNLIIFQNLKLRNIVYILIYTCKYALKSNHTLIQCMEIQIYNT